MKNKEFGKWVKCPKCGNEQVYRGKKDLYTCTNCGLKIKVIEAEKGTVANIKTIDEKKVYNVITKGQKL